MAMSVARALLNELDIPSLVRQLDVYTPCVTVFGNSVQHRNLERLTYLVKKILTVREFNFARIQQEKKIEAMLFAAEKHKGVYRKDNVTPYLIHTLETVCILIDRKVFDYKITIAAIIHDVVEDTDATLQDVRERFGFTIARIVELLTKHPNFIKRWGYWWLIKNERDLHVRWRVIVIKFADRTHNLMTLSSMPEESRKKKIKETLEEFPDLYKVLIKTLQTLRKKEVLVRDKYLDLPFHLNNRLFYEMSRYQ